MPQKLGILELQVQQLARRQKLGDKHCWQVGGGVIGGRASRCFGFFTALRLLDHGEVFKRVQDDVNILCFCFFLLENRKKKEKNYRHCFGPCRSSVQAGTRV